MATEQPDLDEEVLGPPARVAFDTEGKPTKAALAFAQKLGVEVATLSRKDTDKGEYLVGRRVEQGLPAKGLLAAALAEVCAKIPFRKSMRWSDGDVPFGRPVRWIVALLGADEVDVEFAGVRSGRATAGHRFLAPGPHQVAHARDYVESLAQGPRLRRDSTNAVAR